MIDLTYYFKNNLCTTSAQKVLNNGKTLVVEIVYYNKNGSLKRSVSSFKLFKNGKLILGSCVYLIADKSERCKELIKDDIFLELYNRIYVEWESSEEGKNILNQLGG